MARGHHVDVVRSIAIALRRVPAATRHRVTQFCRQSTNIPLARNIGKASDSGGAGDYRDV
jgi:hypothetical protein